MFRAKKLVLVLTAMMAVATVGSPTHAAAPFSLTISGTDTFYPGLPISTPFRGALTILGAGVPSQAIELRLDGVPAAGGVTDSSGNYSIQLAPINDRLDHVVTAVAFKGTPLETSATTQIQVKRFLLTIALSGNGNGSVTSSPAAINCPSACSASIPATTPVTLNIVAGPGFVFSGWTGGCGGNGPCSITMTQAFAATARFDTPAQLIVTPASWSEPVSANQTAFKTFVVKNLGGATSGPVSWTVYGSGSSYYTPVGSTCGAPLQGGATCSITLKFTQGGIFDGGVKYATLSINASPGGGAFAGMSVG